MKRKHFLLLYIVCLSCSPNQYLGSKKVNDFLVEWKSSENQISECEVIELKFKFSNIDKLNRNYIFNIYDLSYDCNGYENTTLGIFKSLELIGKLKNSHFIISNAKGDYVIYDEKIVGKDIPALSDDCTYKYLNELNTKNHTKPDFITSTLVCKKDLLINSNDSEIILYYYFNPTIEQQEFGFTPIIIRSNKISLN